MSAIDWDREFEEPWRGIGKEFAKILPTPHFDPNWPPFKAKPKPAPKDLKCPISPLRYPR
jgi:hypothetical protein